jgi:regulator of cell morphogenesis and NO signaling
MTTMHETVGDLVAERPDWARVFEELGIDYCCGGRRTLREACERRGLGLDAVLRRLAAADAEQATSEPDWTAAPLTHLCDHIVHTHHEFLRRELPRVGRLLTKVTGVHGDRHPELFRVEALYGPFARDMDHHMAKEEMVLFPLIKRMAEGEPVGMNPLAPIGVMEAEHDQAGAAMAEMRRLTDEFRPPEGACASYRAALAGLHAIEQDLHRHVHKENNILFPRASRLATAAAVRAGGGR